ncbi:MAG: hypothetical protein IJ335_00650 [Lachnospiraceae bacterium]|nr:hypothetical protein [Lachnospiraceae bacterium]
MGFTGILDLKQSPFKERGRPDFYLDLNLNQIIERICQEWGPEVASYYYYFPADKECETYRRDILADIKDAQLYEPLKLVTEMMQSYKEAGIKKEKISIKLQKAVWYIYQVGYYCDCCRKLYEILEQASLASEGLQALRTYLRNYLEQDVYRAAENHMNTLRDRLKDIHLTLYYENSRVIISQQQCEGSYDSFLRQCFPGHDSVLRNPLALEQEFTALEQELLKVFNKMNPDIFADIMKFYKESKEYDDKRLVQSIAELRFYLSFLQFEQKMERTGFAFAVPTVEEEQEFTANGLYDLALACVNLGRDKEVVSNDLVYHDKERFFVVTGPNQGGKTTFARSLGQLVYFCKMGLDVPAVSANVHYYKDILTHFSVEESVESGRGKLKEELRRLAPMMSRECSGSFIIINELFTTAANYDACIMGKRVLEHFIKDDCHGIYVTHLKELSEGNSQVVSMRAMLDENQLQNFKIVRSVADDTACAVNQVNKYRLTYEQLKERLV